MLGAERLYSLPILEARNVWKRYSTSSWVLRGGNLSLEPGEGVLIVGANGSGKTTLLRILAGLMRPSRGSVKVNGLPPYSPRARRLLGVVLHHSLLYPELTVKENLTYYASLYGLKNYNPLEDEVFKSLGLKPYVSKRVGELSFGWRKRVDLVRALMHRPKLLLVDEPFTGLDDSAARVLSMVLRKLMDSGLSIIATSPQEHVVSYLPNFKIYRIVDGRLVEEG